MDRYDLIVVGGGIGGSALASVMARAGRSVLLLERSEVFEDHVRGEWMAPWGVAEARRIGLLDLLKAAGAHHLTRHVTYDDSLPPADAEAATLPLGIFAPDVPGPLCIGHPHHCQTLIDEAARAGAEVLRGVDVLSVEPGSPAQVAFTTADGVRREASARLLVGADGRNSIVRDSSGVPLHADKPHHFIGGMLMAEVEGWDDERQGIGVEDDFNFFTFPQGDGRVRIYGCFALEDRSRYSGANGPREFIARFHTRCCPENERLTRARQAGPLHSYANNDTWTERPFAEGVVLIGDAAGWNDPIIGQGLSLAYRDVRIVSELLLGSDDWSPALFGPYAEERGERMRRQRFAAAMTAALDAEFHDAARERRRAFLQRAAVDPSLRAHVQAAMAGPDSLPPEVFTPEFRAHVLGG